MKRIIQTLIVYLFLFSVFPMLSIAEAANANAANAKSTAPVAGTNMEKEDKMQKFNDKWQEKYDKAKVEHKDKVEERWENRCSNIEQRLLNRVDRFTANKELHLEHYALLSEKVADVLLTLEDRGYDTLELETDLETLDTMIQNYAAEYDKFIGLLEDAQEYTCGESHGVFAQAVKDARDQLKVVHATRLEIKNFYKDEIREDIKDLRKQTPAVVMEEEEEEVNEVVPEEGEGEEE